MKKNGGDNVDGVDADDNGDDLFKQIEMDFFDNINPNGGTKTPIDRSISPSKSDPYHIFASHQMSRRAVLSGGTVAGVAIGALIALHKLGIPGVKTMIVDYLKDDGFVPESGEALSEDQYFEEAERLVHKIGIGGINAMGLMSFIDVVVAIGLKRDSFVQKICVMLGIPTYNTGEMKNDGHGHEKQKFPIENAYLAMIFHALRIAIDDHAGEHSISELKTTVVGVGMLSFFTSFAKGMNSISEETDNMVHVEGMMMVKNPNKVLAKSIFQLTVLASLTQFPLFAFGNASIGNEQFPEVQASFKTMYLSVLPGGKNLPGLQNLGEKLMALPQSENGINKEYALALIENNKSDFPQIYDAVISKLASYTGSWDAKIMLQMMMDIRTKYILNEALERADKLENKEVGARIKHVLGSKFDHLGLGEMRKALNEESTKHSNDLMSILMATSCDDTQAAFGDLGPIVGLFQAYGNNAVYAMVSTAPYTLMVGAERAMWACKRSGVPLGDVFNKANQSYAIEFWKTAVSNLVRHFASKFSSHVNNNSEGNVGVQYSITDQMMNDLQSAIGGVIDAGLGSLNGDTLNYAKVQKAIKVMKAGNDKYSQALGQQVREKARARQKGSDHIQIRVAGMGEVKDDVMGAKSQHPDLRQIQEKLNRLSLDLTDKEISNKAPEIQEFLDHLKSLDGYFYDEIEVALAELKAKEGDTTPSIMSVAALLQKNPKITTLLDFNYWHDRLGPELTDTIFVVTLQGLHLPFIIEAVQVAYDHPAFKSMPLGCRNWVSCAINNGISSVADNWADAIAHAYWLKKMYFDEVHKFVDGAPKDHRDFAEYGVGLSNQYPEVKKQLENGFFTIQNAANKNITEQFDERKQQFAALIEFLIENHPEDKVQLTDLRLIILDKLEQLYWQSMEMSLLTAVTGGGKLITGNAPHYTFAADIDEFDFKSTKDDLINHPLYHIWEFIFSTTYSTIVGPAIANTFFGEKAVKTMQQMMQKQFKQDFPVFYEKINELKASELVGVKKQVTKSHNAHFTPSATVSMPKAVTGVDADNGAVDSSRRQFFGSFMDVFNK